MALLVLMLIVLFAVTYAQVIWAQIALAILIILGPIFIPFLVFEPLAFLFWGWFKGMLTYSLYAVIAGCVLRVFSAPWGLRISRRWAARTLTPNP